MQLYPYHSGLGVPTLLHDFAVHPFSNMLLFRRVSPLGKLDDLTGIFLSLWRVSRNYLCRHAAHQIERDLVKDQRREVDQIQARFH